MVRGVVLEEIERTKPDHILVMEHLHVVQAYLENYCKSLKDMMFLFEDPWLLRAMHRYLSMYHPLSPQRKRDVPRSAGHTCHTFMNIAEPLGERLQPMVLAAGRFPAAVPASFLEELMSLLRVILDMRPGFYEEPAQGYKHNVYDSSTTLVISLMMCVLFNGRQTDALLAAFEPLVPQVWARYGRDSGDLPLQWKSLLLVLNVLRLKREATPAMLQFASRHAPRLLSETVALAPLALRSPEFPPYFVQVLA